MAPMKLERRQVLSGLCASAVWMRVDKAMAFSKLKVGPAQVIALSDGTLTAPATFFGNITDAQQAELGKTVQLAANTYAYTHADRTFLFDTGAGVDHYISQQFPALGKLPADLAAAGIDPSAITDIVITHMHIDHIGGLVQGGAAVFPKARVHVSKADWDFWTKKDVVKLLPDLTKPMASAAQFIGKTIGETIRTHAGEADLGAGVALIPAPGHTPGHSAVMLTSGSEQLMLVGDAVVSEKVHFAYPDASWALEFDPPLAAKTRRSILDRAATDKIKIAGSHFSSPGTGFVERAGANFKFVAA